MILCLAVFGIRIQIRMFLVLPDQLVTGTDPDPAPDPSLSHKSVKWIEIIIAK